MHYRQANKNQIKPPQSADDESHAKYDNSNQSEHSIYTETETKS